jgi:hypothetical protein
MTDFDNIILLVGENISAFRIFGHKDPARHSYFNVDSEGAKIHSHESKSPYIGNDGDSNYHSNIAKYLNVDPDSGIAAMDGFVKHGAQFNPDKKDIMAYYSPKAFPMLNYLADNFQRCEKYFCSWPGDTLPNIHLLTHIRPHHKKFSKELNTNPYFVKKEGDVFELMNKNGTTWKVYAGDWCNLLHFNTQWKIENLAQYCSHDQLYSDIENDNLPAVSYVDTHFQYTTSDKKLGYLSYYDDLIRNIYTRLYNSKKYWSGRTLFIVTFDEAGGYFDPVPPPHGLGIRVPTVFINPNLFQRGPENKTILHHESITKLLLTNFSLLDFRQIQESYDDTNDIIIKEVATKQHQLTNSCPILPSSPIDYTLEEETYSYRLLFPALTLIRKTGAYFALTVNRWRCYFSDKPEYACFNTN